MPERAASAASCVADFLGDRSLTAITGGGGKTTLLFALADRLALRADVVVTTTTKLCAGAGGHVSRILGEPDGEAIRAALGEHRSVLIADRVTGGKLIGFGAETVDAMARSGVADHILVEADGAKRKPFKAYESWEPVVPRSTTHQIVVVGAEPFIEPLSEKNTFRASLLLARWGVRPGERMPFGTIVQMLGSRDEYLRGTPERAKRLLVVNKCDLFPDSEQIKKLAHDLISSLPLYDALLFASLAHDEVYDYSSSVGRA